MISIDELTKEPIKLKKGMTTNPALNKVLSAKNIGSLINEIGGASASVGMGQDLVGPGLETAIEKQPGTRPSGSYDNIKKPTPVSRDYIRGGNLQLKNVTKKVPGIENVNVGKGPPFLEKNTTKAGKNYVNNVVKYVQGMGDDVSAKAVSGGSFKGANPQFDKIRSSLIKEAEAGNKGILRTYFTETKKANEGVLINGKRYTMNKGPLDKLFKKVSGYVGKEDTKNFVKLVDQEILKQGGKLSGKTGLVKDFILNEAQRLYRLGDKAGAKTILTALATSIPTIVKALPLGPVDLFIPSPMGSGELPKEGTPEYEQLMKDMGKNQGGMMDINFMTRPLGYKDGTRGGSTVGDLEKNVKGIPSDADVKAVTDLLAKPTGTGSMASLKNLINTMNEVRGVPSDEDVSAVEKSLPFPGLREFAASEVMRAAGDQKRVDTIQLASDYLRSIGMSGNEAAMNNVINILNTKIVPEEELKIMKEGESSLEKGIQGIGRGIEGLLQFLKLQEEGTGKFQTLDDRTLQEIIKMRTQ